MPPLILVESYVGWHYGRAYSDLYHVWMNLLWFAFNFFSIFLLLQTLFAPWKRMDEGYPKGLDIQGWLSTLTVNTLMRIVGAATRLFIVLIGLAFASAIFLGGIIVFVVWTIMPVFLISTLFLGVYLIFS